MRVVFTRRHLQELASIGDYIAERNPQAAHGIVTDIHSKAKRFLSDNPFIVDREK